MITVGLACVASFLLGCFLTFGLIVLGLKQMAKDGRAKKNAELQAALTHLNVQLRRHRDTLRRARGVPTQKPTPLN
jgi:hypothetical protein